MILNMVENTGTDYENFIQANITKEILLLEISIDNMLTRLEEFESMIKMVQQQTGNIIGITGTISQVFENIDNLNQLFLAIDNLEGLVVKVKNTLDFLESQVELAEDQYEYLENNTFKSFFKPKIFKKVSGIKIDVSKLKAMLLDANDYFL